LHTQESRVHQAATSDTRVQALVTNIIVNIKREIKEIYPEIKP
jgi:hypothetical protein